MHDQDIKSRIVWDKEIHGKDKAMQVDARQLCQEYGDSFGINVCVAVGEGGELHKITLLEDIAASDNEILSILEKHKPQKKETVREMLNKAATTEEKVVALEKILITLFSDEKIII